MFEFRQNIIKVESCFKSVSFVLIRWLKKRKKMKLNRKRKRKKFFFKKSKGKEEDEKNFFSGKLKFDKNNAALTNVNNGQLRMLPWC